MRTLLWTLLALCLTATVVTAARNETIALVARVAAVLLATLMTIGVLWRSLMHVLIGGHLLADDAVELAAGFWVTLTALAVLAVAAGIGLRHPPTGR